MLSLCFIQKLFIRFASYTQKPSHLRRLNYKNFLTTKGKGRKLDRFYRYRPPGGVLEYTCFIGSRFGEIKIYKEAIPELVVPDLTNFKLKPYVSYRAKEVVQKELTDFDLFQVCYAKPYVENCKKLLESGETTALLSEFSELKQKLDLSPSLKYSSGEVEKDGYD